MAKLFPEIKVPPPGPKARAVIEVDKQYSSPSYIKEYPLVVDRGEGPWIYDVDGNRYLDYMAGIAVNSTGHSHPKVVDAIKQASEKFLHICGTDFYYDSFAKLCAKLASYLPKMGPKKVFLTNSGTEAVDGALKLVRYHTRRQYVVAFKGGFHGRTYGAISLNSSKVGQRAFFGPMVPGVVHIPYANPYRCPIHQAPGKCSGDCVSATVLETDWFVNHVDPREVAAVFIEPILGEGGYVVPPVQFLKDLRRICDQHGILLVFDEIQSGIGRTGQMFAAEHFDVMPDIILSAKGLASGMPIGAIMAKESVMTWPRGSHGSTFGGNPVCCAAALATLDVIEGLLANIRETGDMLKAGLASLQKKHAVIGDVRGVGLMIGAEFVVPKTGEPAGNYVGDLEQLAFSKGLLLLSCGKSTIRFAPPLVIGPHEVEVGLKILDECLSTLDQKHGITHATPLDEK
ncbi:MAG: acetyl ornithine aminotransferase family protein, partial [Deltaproteobacteria bacterium]|nr:acetyl ornithine aminotransferase family protein [Deltaproteobacteria bacterium]